MKIIPNWIGVTPCTDMYHLCEWYLVYSAMWHFCEDPKNIEGALPQSVHSKRCYENMCSENTHAETQQGENKVNFNHTSSFKIN